MRLRIAALALACAIASPLAVHADDGLPAPSPTKTPRPLPDDDFQRVVFKTGAATMTLLPSGDYDVRYPSNLATGLLAHAGIAILSSVSGHATPSELAAIKSAVGSNQAIEALGYGGPLWDNLVLSKRPFALTVERAGFVPARFENNGKPSPDYNLVRVAALLNGLVDRATDGYVYGSRGKTVAGTLAAAKNLGGGTALTLTTDDGHVYALHGSAAESHGYTALKDTTLPGVPALGAAALVGSRVTVHGVLDDGDLVPTRAIERAPAKDPAATPGLLGALRVR